MHHAQGRHILLEHRVQDIQLRIAWRLEVSPVYYVLGLVSETY